MTRLAALALAALPLASLLMRAQAPSCDLSAYHGQPGLTASNGADGLTLQWDAEAELAVALDVVLKDSLEDLHGELDPRTAVIRTYARMEQTFAAYGVPRQPAEAPLEYVARVLDRLQVSAFAAERLTKLFARAKFSTHEIDAGMKAEAIEALSGLRVELEHTAEAA